MFKRSAIILVSFVISFFCISAFSSVEDEPVLAISDSNCFATEEDHNLFFCDGNVFKKLQADNSEFGNPNPFLHTVSCQITTHCSSCAGNGTRRCTSYNCRGERVDGYTEACSSW